MRASSVEAEVVLLVAFHDWDQWQVALMEAALAPLGFQVLTALSVAELLHVYREREEIDLVVVNTYNLSGTDGPEILDALREIAPQVRCGFITGECRRDKLDELTKRGAVGVLEKPWRFGELPFVLREWSRRP